jgi:hypothetical protein
MVLLFDEFVEFITLLLLLLLQSVLFPLLLLLIFTDGLAIFGGVTVLVSLLLFDKEVELVFVSKEREELILWYDED